MINLDANATTPPCAPALAAVTHMLEILARGGANPSSLHAQGQVARARVEHARAQVARSLGGRGGKVVFTSGATEANALAWHGVLDPLLAKGQPVRVVTSTVEHPSVLALARHFSVRGAEIVWLPVDASGRLDPSAWHAAFAAPVSLCSVMTVQNELGVIYPIADLAARTHAAGGLFHTDATQAPGRIALDLDTSGADLASVSGHKAGALAGTGALWVRRGTQLTAHVAGHQEDGLRGGTENVLGIAAMGAAFAQLSDALNRMEELRGLRDRLWESLALLPGSRRNAAVASVEETGHVLNLAFEGVDGPRLVRALDLEGYAVSSGAACASGTAEPSHVLLALGQETARARQSLRISLGPAALTPSGRAGLAALPAVLSDVVVRIRACVPVPPADAA